MKSLCALLFLVAGACGDNAPECGPGTSNVGGFCTPDGSTICGDGTKFDPDTGACLPDPTLCSDGTVLINGTCQDPTGGLTIDLEEGPEPNGFEPNANTAGTIDLKPIGDPHGFVVHGCIRPTTDVADLDDYRIAVSAPTLIDVTADGVRGLAAGFAVFGDDPALASWRRFGINLQTDTSHRQIYLPKAGTYEFVMSDTRSLMGLFDGSNDVLEPAGNPDGTSCYYVTLNQLAIPALTTLQVPVGVNDMIDDKVQFYAAALPTGVIDLQETILSSHAAPAFVVDVSGQLRLDHDGEVAFAGVKAADTTMIAIDFVYNYAFTPPSYLVSFAAATTAQALPTDGTTVTAVSKTQVGTSFNTTNQFYFDADTTPLGMALVSTKQVQGVIWDSDLNVVTDFGGLGAQQSFTSFDGLWRAPKAGRYLFALIDPVDGANTSFTITSTVAAVTPQEIVTDTPLTGQVPNQFQTNLYTLQLEDEWDLFDVTTTNIPGSSTLRLFDRTTAAGRLDPLVVTTASGTTTLAPTSPAPLSFDFPPPGAPRGFIVATLTGSYFLTVRTNPPSGTPTFDLSVAFRVYSDLIGITQTLASETAPLGDAHRYYMPDLPGSQVQLTVTPSTGDPILETLSADESVHATSDHPGGVVETLTSTIGLERYLAFQVRGPTAQTYSLDIVVTPPFYTSHVTTTAYANACASGTELQLHDNISDPQVTPTAFTFYGASPNQYLITANGYITFDLADNGLATRTALPDGVGIGNIAPLWEPLAGVSVCISISGFKTTIQWTGTELGRATSVQFQAILDATDSSIEFVYGPNNQSNGQRLGAIGGVQDPTGTRATPTGNGAFAPFAAPGTSLKLTHP
jgi:hypothetical protein